jgi:hypothetical protein
MPESSPEDLFDRATIHAPLPKERPIPLAQTSPPCVRADYFRPPTPLQ